RIKTEALIKILNGLFLTFNFIDAIPKNSFHDSCFTLQLLKIFYRYDIRTVNYNLFITIFFLQNPKEIHLLFFILQVTIEKQFHKKVLQSLSKMTIFISFSVCTYHMFYLIITVFL